MNCTGRLGPQQLSPSRTGSQSQTPTSPAQPPTCVSVCRRKCRLDNGHMLLRQLAVAGLHRCPRCRKVQLQHALQEGQHLRQALCESRQQQPLLVALQTAWRVGQCMLCSSLLQVVCMPPQGGSPDGLQGGGQPLLFVQQAGQPRAIAASPSLTAMSSLYIAISSAT